MRARAGRKTLAVGLLFGLLAGGLLAQPARPPRGGRAVVPLPAGAVARLGTTRFRHGDTVTHLAFTPDGKRLATGSYGRPEGVRLWDAADGSLLRHFNDHVSGGFALSPDGETIALLSGATVRVCDLATGQERRRFAVDLTAELLAFAPDRRTLALWGIDRQKAPSGANVVALYDVTTGNLVRRLERPQDAAVLGDINRQLSGANTAVKFLAFTQGGRTVAAAGWDKVVCFWDVRTGQELRQLADPRHPACRFALSPDGRTLAAAGDDNALRLYDVATGKERRLIHGKGGSPYCLAFSPDGQRLASAEAVAEGRQWIGVVKVWQVPSGERVAEMPACTAHTMAFDPDGKTLATCDRAGTVRLWNAATGKELRPDGGHRGLVVGLAFAPDGKTLVSEADDRTVRWWDVKAGRQVRQVAGHSGALHGCLAFSPDGRTLAIMRGDDHSITLRDAVTGKERGRLAGHTGVVYHVAFTPDGKRLVSAERDGPAIVWDLATGKEVRRVRHSYRSGQAVGLSADGALLAAARDYYDGSYPGPHEMEIWDTATGRRVGKFALTTRGPAGPMVFSPDRKWLIAGTYRDGCICIVDVATGKEKARWAAHDIAVGLLALSPDGKTLASSGVSWHKNTIRVGDVASGKELGHFPANGYQLYALAFSPDGRRLAAGGADTTILLWDVGRLRH